MRMKIQQGFCPRCGEPSDGICGRCRAKEVEVIGCDARVESVECPSCGAVRQGTGWADLPTDRAERAPSIAASGVHLHPDLRDVQMGIRIEDLSTNRSFATVEVKGSFHGAVIERTCRIEILWHKEQCSRCNRISGGYYEGLVQVRAKGRRVSPREVETAGRIACDVERTLLEQGERLSFISDMEENKDGLDVVVGTQHLGLLITQQIMASLGGRYTTHPKLVGEKDGRALYRVTYSVRLPFFQRGDVIAIDRSYLEVRDVEREHLRVFDLMAGSMRTVPDDETARIIGNVRDAKEALVAYAEKSGIGVIDPETCATVVLAPVPWLTLAAGTPVRVLRDRETDQLVLVG
jgi:nonsense-mediated mRNA decay protein 3